MNRYLRYHLWRFVCSILKNGIARFVGWSSACKDKICLKKEAFVPERVQSLTGRVRMERHRAIIAIVWFDLT